MCFVSHLKALHWTVERRKVRNSTLKESILCKSKIYILVAVEVLKLCDSLKLSNVFFNRGSTKNFSRMHTTSQFVENEITLV